MGTDELLIKVERLKTMLVSRATGGDLDIAEFSALRRELLAEQRIASRLPAFLQVCRSEGEFWAFIKGKFATYQERRDYLRDQFDPALKLLEARSAAPADEGVADGLAAVDSDHVRDAWNKALDRRATDLDGAITMARTLLETVCKHILEESGVAHDDKADLPKLYSLTAQTLTLAPSQHTETVVKQILGGCQAVVEGLGALRNRLGDAHGRGKGGAQPAPRHAELAVNLAGSMATFLVATWEARTAAAK